MRILPTLNDLRNLKVAGLWALLVMSLLTFAAGGFLYAGKHDANGKMARLRAGTDVVVDPATARPALLDARAAFLLRRGRIDEAQPLLDQALVRGDVVTRGRMLYNMANARMRAAIAAIEKGDYDKAVPMVMLAKAEYRNALRIDAANWDAKYNLDIAMRLVRDLPQAVGEDEQKPLETPEKLWTDLPGVPKGLP
jgi:mxaK protein